MYDPRRAGWNSALVYPVDYEANVEQPFTKEQLTSTMVANAGGDPIARLLLETITGAPIVSYSAPAALGWSSLLPITATGAGAYYGLNQQPKAFVNAGIWTGPAYHVDGSLGNDAATGLGGYDGDFTNAVLSIKQAITLGNATGAPYRVIVRSGDYSRNTSINGSAGTVEPSQHCAIIAWGGRCRQFPGTTETFPSSTDNTYTNSFVGGPSNCIRVFDRINKDANGDYVEMTAVADAAAVNSTANSWCNSSATGSSKTHIRRSDGLQPTVANTLIVRNVNTAAFPTASKDLYLEGFDFEGGALGAISITAIASRNIVMVDCSTKYGGYSVTPSNSMTIGQTTGLVLLVRCIASCGWSDGFNFHSNLSTGQLYVATVRCRGYNNGRGTSTSCNGLTAHENIMLIDIGGEYFGSVVGSDIHFIDSVKAWLLGTKATCTDATVTSAAIKVSNTARVYAENVRAQGTRALWTNAGTLYKRNVTSIGQEIIDTGGAIGVF